MLRESETFKTIASYLSRVKTLLVDRKSRFYENKLFKPNWFSRNIVWIFLFVIQISKS
jgi:hypothetical protein